MKKLMYTSDSIESEFIDAMQLLGFKKSSEPAFRNNLVYDFQTDDSRLRIRTSYYAEGPTTVYWVGGKRLPASSAPPDTANFSRMIRGIEHMMQKYGHDIFANYAAVATSSRSSILAAINTRDLSKDMTRVKSSNVWSYKLNVRDRHDKVGDLLVQFKNNAGGPGDLYIYYDVPLTVYRRWQSAPSKGHYFWVYIRNNYKYSKLTGDKRGKLHNAVN